MTHPVSSLMADSPVAFPEAGALPAKFPPDVPTRHEDAEEEYFLFGTPQRSPEQIAAIRRQMPVGRYTSPRPDWRCLQRTRTLLTEGGTFRLLAMGDSIVNDTMRSGWVACLQEAYPRADIEATVYVRGGGGCQHYREERRIERYVAPRSPDCVYIGGISQRSVEDIRAVIGLLRGSLPQVEILLATGTFSSTDPRDSEALAAAPFSGTGSYGRQLRALAEEEHCAYLDMTSPWVEYVLSSGLHPHLFYRDAVHANESGEQILARIMMDFWAAKDDRS